MDPFTRVNLKTSVEFGHLIVPVRNIAGIAERYCSPLTLENEGEAFELAVLGSSILVRYRGKNFQVAAYHQIENQGRSPREIRWVENIAGESILIPPTDGYRPTVNSPDYESLRDLLVVRYPTFLETHINRRFLKLNPNQFGFDSTSKPRTIFGYFFVGFPGSALGYELNTDGSRLQHLRPRWIKVFVVPAPDAIKFVPHRAYFKLQRPFTAIGIKPDGISGSPVFCLYQDEAMQFRACLVGIITDANELGTLAVYEATGIRRLLDDVALARHTIERVALT